MKSLLFLFLIPCTFGCSAGSRSFAPEGCDFTMTFPSAPAISSANQDSYRAFTGDPTAKAPLVAQTPGDELPWIVAQCYPAPSDAKIRSSGAPESLGQRLMARLNATVEATKSSVTPLGKQTISIGNASKGGRQVRVTDFSLVGASSVLYVVIVDSHQPSPASNAFLKSIHLRSGEK